MAIELIECGDTAAKMLNSINLSTEVNTRQVIVDAESIDAKNVRGKNGFRGNGVDANVSLPVNLNGKYTVEFLSQIPNQGSNSRMLDFRDAGGTGTVNIASNTVNPSTGISYVNDIKTTNYPNSALHAVQVSGIDIIATNLTVLSSAFASDYASAFMADLKIYDYYTGELVHWWKFSENGDLPVNDEVGISDSGTINNYYAGFSELTRESYTNTSRWLAWRISQAMQTDCIITHVDGYVEMETIVAPLLQSKSMTANIGVVKTFVEGVDPAFMRESGLATLRDTYGFSIVNHTTSHQNIAALLEVSESSASAEISGCQTFLNNLDHDGDYFIYALSNSANGQTRVLAESLGIKLARLPSVSGWQKVPPIRALEITPISTNVIHTDEGIDNAFYLIDFATASGGVPITYNHNVQSDADALAAGYVNTTGVTFYNQLINRLVGVNANTVTMKAFQEKYGNMML